MRWREMRTTRTRTRTKTRTRRMRRRMRRRMTWFERIGLLETSHNAASNEVRGICHIRALHTSTSSFTVSSQSTTLIILSKRVKTIACVSAAASTVLLQSAAVSSASLSILCLLILHQFMDVGQGPLHNRCLPVAQVTKAYIVDVLCSDN